MSKAPVTRIRSRKPLRLFIHQWMEKRGLTQVDIASRLEVGSSGTISKKLAKPEKMSVEWLARFAQALDLEVEDLYRDPDRPTQEDLLQGLEPAQRAVVIDMIKGLKRA